MPVVNGLEAARHLHQTQSHLPVILCSLPSDDVLQRETAAAGVTAIVSKAHNMETLVRKAREMLAS
jgi:DNA-binding NarL/FixJ family response regulator